MPQYIDIKKVTVPKGFFNKDLGVPDLFEWLESQPAADVVEVVRCRDCRYFTEGMAVGMCKRVEDKPIIPVVYNHFCSYGERKEQT